MSWLPRTMADGFQAANAIDDGVRIGAVSDEVAEHQHGVVALRGRRAKHRLERFKVAVNVAEDQIAHRYSSCSMSCSTSSSARAREASRRSLRLLVGEPAVFVEHRHLDAIVRERTPPVGGNPRQQHIEAARRSRPTRRRR